MCISWGKTAKNGTLGGGFEPPAIGNRLLLHLNLKHGIVTQVSFIFTEWNKKRTIQKKKKKR